MVLCFNKTQGAGSRGPYSMRWTPLTINEENVDTDYDPEVPVLPDYGTDAVANSEESALLTWLLLFLVRLQAKFYLPETALNCLLKFLYIFLSIISRKSTFVAQMINFLLKKYMNSKETFVRYVVCRQCYSVYDYNKNVLIDLIPHSINIAMQNFWRQSTLRVIRKN